MQDRDVRKVILETAARGPVTHLLLIGVLEKDVPSVILRHVNDLVRERRLKPVGHEEWALREEVTRG